MTKTCLALRATILSLFVAACVPAFAAPSVRLELTEGTRVSDLTTVVARVFSPDDVDIQKVEFYLDGALKATDTSTPYSFDWDTLEVSEGPHTLSATAYDAKNQTGTAKVEVVVDNELSKGADYHAGKALEALKEQKVDEAQRYARRALKIAPANLLAARALARIHRENRQLGQAVEVLEKANIPDNDVDARADLVALYIAQAGQSDSSEQFTALARKAIAAYGKLAAARRAAVSAPGPERAAISAGDILFSARDYNRAVAEYQKCGLGENAALECVNRLILAYMHAGRAQQAQFQINSLKRSNKADDATRALEALMLLRAHDFEKAREVAQTGVDNGHLASLIVAGYAELGMGQRNKARELAERAYALAPSLPDVLLLRSYTVPDPIDADKLVLRALEVDPTSPEAYALRGFQTLLSRSATRYRTADAYFDLALKQEPNNSFALMGSALSLLAQKRPQEAETVINQLTALNPKSPDVHFVRAEYFLLTGKDVRMQPELEAARKLDSERWGDVLVPEMPELIARVYRFRFPLVLTPAALDPAPRA